MILISITQVAIKFLLSPSFLAYTRGPFINASPPIAPTIARVKNKLNICGARMSEGRFKIDIIRKKALTAKHIKAFEVSRFSYLDGIPKPLLLINWKY